MHDAEASTLGECFAKVIDFGRKQGTFAFVVVHDEAGDWSSVFKFGRADDVSGGSTYYGRTALDVVRPVYDEIRHIEEVVV